MQFFGELKDIKDATMIVIIGEVMVGSPGRLMVLCSPVSKH